MALSEEEQRLLEQMEQALVAEDPKFASTLRGSTMRARSRRQAIAAGLGFLVGLALLMVGAVVTLTVLAVVGFVLMLGGAYMFVTLWRRSQHTPADQPPPSSGTSPRRGVATRGQSSGSFMNRMEERWRRRRDDDDQ